VFSFWGICSNFRCSPLQNWLLQPILASWNWYEASEIFDVAHNFEQQCHCWGCIGVFVHNRLEFVFKWRPLVHPKCLVCQPSSKFEGPLTTQHTVRQTSLPNKCRHPWLGLEESLQQGTALWALRASQIHATVTFTASDLLATNHRSQQEPVTQPLNTSQCMNTTTTMVHNCSAIPFLNHSPSQIFWISLVHQWFHMMPTFLLHPLTILTQLWLLAF
jgi:hypothetical protein